RADPGDCAEAVPVEAEVDVAADGDRGGGRVPEPPPPGLGTPLGGPPCSSTGGGRGGCGGHGVAPSSGLFRGMRSISPRDRVVETGQREVTGFREVVTPPHISQR